MVQAGSGALTGAGAPAPAYPTAWPRRPPSPRPPRAGAPDVAPRWATAAEARAFLEGRPHGAATLWARGVLIGAEAGLRERIARGWGALTLHHPAAGYVAGLFTYPDRPRIVWEHGVELFDPEGILEGAGRQVRTQDIAAMDDVTAQAIEAFLAQSVALRA